MEVVVVRRGEGSGEVCEMDSLDSDGSNPRPGITSASCVTVYNHHAFLSLGCGVMVVRLPYGLRAGNAVCTDTSQ